MIRIKVHGTPAPQGSKNTFAVRKGGVYTGKTVTFEQSGGLKPWRERIASETQRVLENGQVPYDHEPVLVKILFYLQRPQNHYGSRKGVRYVKESAPARPVTFKRNDIDKLARAVLDGITEGGALRDDGQVASLIVDKYFSDETFPPGALITVTELA